MQQQTKNVLAAAATGVMIGAVVTAVLMSSADPRPEVLDRARPEAISNPDDVVAVLDADTPVAGHPAPAASSGPADSARRADAPSAIDPSVPTISAGTGAAVDDLRRRGLVVPVQGIEPSKLLQTFDDQRSGARRHEAIDILAPRNTPVLAIEDGTAARLFSSRAGGITLYQFDPTEKFVYYYAHLERYADGIKEGAPLRRGQVIGYVGTTGNAPPNTPHLHFAIFELTGARRWWEGAPIDPYLVLR